tara:strand:- start:27 stop:698 length:672 start_codon:yes stop_codon:yes gene_type:complete
MICILQVRSSSKRLKEKAFLKLNQKLVIENVVDRLLLSKKISRIILATSNHSSDDKFKNLFKNKKVLVFRGSLVNVYLRYSKLIKKHNLKYFLRISGDSPLIDYRIIDKAFKIFKTNNYEIVTNTFKRSFPKGQSVEIIKSKIFLENSKQIMSSSTFKEHVTKYFYKNHKKFKIYNFKNNNDFSSFNLSIDTDKDYKKIKKIIINLNKNFKWQTALKRYISLK